MKKTIVSLVSAFVMAIMFFGVSTHAEYDTYNRTTTNGVTDRVYDNNRNYDYDRVNNDVRTRNVNTTNDAVTTTKRPFNWAWLGLFGLLGLLGMRNRDKEPRRD